MYIIFHVCRRFSIGIHLCFVLQGKSVAAVSKKMALHPSVNNADKAEMHYVGERATGRNTK